MGNSADFEIHRERITAFPAEKIVKSSIPIAIYFTEAEALAIVSDTDRPQLTMTGLADELIDGLPSLIGAARECQSIWTVNRFGKEEVQKQWDTLLPQAYELRDEILHCFRYAFRKDEHLLGRVSAIAEGSGSSDLIQDLNDVAVLGRDQLALLQAIKYDEAKLVQAAALSDEMGSLLAVKGSSTDRNECRLMRDKAFSLLKESIDELYACGQYLFHKDEDHKKCYSSAYERERNRRNYQKRKAAAE